jgi:hypothetical protein
MGEVLVAPKKNPIPSPHQSVPAPLPSDLPHVNPESKRTLYIGLGIGAVVVLGGAYLLLRR